MPAASSPADPATPASHACTMLGRCASSASRREPSTGSICTRHRRATASRVVGPEVCISSQLLANSRSVTLPASGSVQLRSCTFAAVAVRNPFTSSCRLNDSLCSRPSGSR